MIAVVGECEAVAARVPASTAPMLAVVGARPSAILEPPFERKYLVTAAQAVEIIAWAAEHLEADPHAAPGSGGMYRVASLYLDSPGLDVYHRRGSFGRAKYRIRRYGTAPGVFLERKCKVKGRVRKRRTLVGPDELDWLAGGCVPRDWAGRWFARRAEARALEPTCLVAYRRVARVGEGPNGPIRLTIDDEFLCRRAVGFEPPGIADGAVLFPGRAVLELKYRRAMPALFKGLVSEFGLVAARASKYRSAIETCGLIGGPGREAGDA